MNLKKKVNEVRQEMEQEIEEDIEEIRKALDSRKQKSKP